MTAAQYDFSAIEGNTLPIKLRLPRFDATGSTFRFRCRSPGGRLLERDSAVGDITLVVEPDPEAPGMPRSVIEFSLSPADTRALDEGRVNAYELERRIDDTESTLLAGYVVIARGVNDDE